MPSAADPKGSAAAERTDKKSTASVLLQRWNSEITTSATAGDIVKLHMPGTKQHNDHFRILAVPPSKGRVWLLYVGGWLQPPPCKGRGLAGA